MCCSPWVCKELDTTERLNRKMKEGRVINEKSKKKVIPEPVLSGCAVLSHSVTSDSL